MVFQICFKHFINFLGRGFVSIQGPFIHKNDVFLDKGCLNEELEDSRAEATSFDSAGARSKESSAR